MASPYGAILRWWRTRTSPGRLTAVDAQAFIAALAKRLDVNPKHALPGYEDAWYYLWKERRLPVNVSPLDSKLENAEDRARLARIFEQGLSKVVGYALPLRREYYTDGTSAWESGAWFFRPEQMYLIPGDSPMGLRLPLDSIPWVSRVGISAYVRAGSDGASAARCPIVRRFRSSDTSPACRRRESARITSSRLLARCPRSARARETHPSDLPPLEGESAPWIIRTALCTEVRGGVLRVFMPPQHYLEDYLELVAAIEDTAANLGLPVLSKDTPRRTIRA